MGVERHRPIYSVWAEIQRVCSLRAYSLHRWLGQVDHL